jgi:hypothetical protein
MKGFLIGLGVLIAIGVGIAIWAVGLSNSEIKLRNKISGQQEMTEAYYTKLWEVIQSKAGVASEYADKFKEIQVGIMEGRYATGGTLMKWIQEANPGFDASLYKDLMASIEGQREGFFTEQVKLRDMAVQHSNMLKTWPSKMIVGEREAINVIILKNVATTKAYETGTDSSPVIFSKEKK